MASTDDTGTGGGKGTTTTRDAIESNGSQATSESIVSRSTSIALGFIVCLSICHRQCSVRHVIYFAQMLNVFFCLYVEHVLFGV